MSIASIVIESGRLPDFRRNPQAFIDLAADLINIERRRALAEGVAYRRLGEEEFYAQELFEGKELITYLDRALDQMDKSVFDHVVCDSAVERRFAEDLEAMDAVKVYAKLPGWFTVPTPLGDYRPDWAVVLDTEQGLRLYLVAETKHTLLSGLLRPDEQAKIRCGQAHFAELQGARQDDGEGSANLFRTVTSALELLEE
jgi:type III restriction enzyme